MNSVTLVRACADTLVWLLARKISLEFSQFSLGRKSVDHWPHKVPEANTSKLYRSQRLHTILQNSVLQLFRQVAVTTASLYEICNNYEIRGSCTTKLNKPQSRLLSRVDAI